MLAGGAARRFEGRPKGLLPVGGRRILDRVVDALAGATGALPLLVANAPDAAQWRPDLRTVPDRRAGCGALGGIYTAVTAGDEAVLTVAWDLPFVSTALLRALVDAAPSWDALLPESGGPRGVEPLCAVYGAACGPAIADRLDAGDMRAIGFHGAVRAGTLPLARVRDYGDPDTLFFNVNTPDDLIRAEALCRTHR